MDYTGILGAEPEETARPGTVEEAAEVVARTDAAGRTVIPWGGGTGQSYGHLPRRADVLLSLGGLNRILAYEPGDLTITAQAGVTLAEVQKVLGAQGQFLPLDPPFPERATVGGILAVNAFGPYRLAHGTARDWLIGLSVVDAQGRVIKGGGKVVKNVTGYDLPKLHVGALGTLGVIVEATFKVAPVPESSAVQCYQLPPGAPGREFVARLHAEYPPTLSILHRGGLLDLNLPLGRYLLVAFEGLQEVVRGARAGAGRLADECGVAAVMLPGGFSKSQLVKTSGGSSRLRVRLTGRSSTACTQHEALAAMEGWEWVRTLPGTGHTEAALRMGEDAEAAARWILAWAQEQQIPIALLQAAASLRREGEVWSPLPPSLPLMRRMKETLDPNGTLNPGRFVGRI